MKTAEIEGSCMSERMDKIGEESRDWTHRTKEESWTCTKARSSSEPCTCNPRLRR